MNNDVTVHITCKNTDGAVPQLPVYKTADAAGADLCAFIESDITLQPGKRILVPTGLYMQIPSGYEGQIRPRSGLALKNGITCLNTPGTIDADYRGEIGVILINLGDEPFVIHNGDRIAQIVIAPVTQSCFCCVDNLAESQRGGGGFGSTGV